MSDTLVCRSVVYAAVSNLAFVQEREAEAKGAGTAAGEALRGVVIMWMVAGLAVGVLAGIQILKYIGDSLPKFLVIVAILLVACYVVSQDWLCALDPIVVCR